MLYAGSSLVIFYGSNTWAYTPLGRITDKTGPELEALLGGEGVTAVLSPWAGSRTRQDRSWRPCWAGKK